MRRPSLRRSLFARPLGAPWLAAWLCLFAMVAQLALPFAHEIEEAADSDDADAVASFDPSEIDLRVSDVVPVGHRHRHVHDEATCPICRALNFARAAVVPTPPAPTFVEQTRGPTFVPVWSPALVAASLDRSWTARAPPAA